MIEGLGHTISNLTINNQDQNSLYTAMVETVDTTGVIENLRLTNESAQVSGNDALVINGTNETSAAAGLAGSNDGSIVSCWANVQATGGFSAGAAGLAVYNGGTIELSHAAGAIDGPVAGGLVADNERTISQSYATASVNGDDAGGLVSYNETDQIPATIDNSYATGNVTGGSIGGLLYEQAGDEISSSYATGAVPSGSGGFLCNFFDDNFTTDYWDTTTSGAASGICDGNNYSKIVGLTTRQLQKRLPAGFDKKIWAENPHINNGLPYLINNPPVK